jgi:hypothetical protein
MSIKIVDTKNCCHNVILALMWYIHMFDNPKPLCFTNDQYHYIGDFCS